MPIASLLLGFCAAAYVMLAAVILARSRRLAPLLLAGCGLVTAGWAVLGLMYSGEVGVQGVADLVRAASWFGFILYLYHDARLGRRVHEAGFAVAGGLAVALGIIALLAPLEIVAQAGVPVHLAPFQMVVPIAVPLLIVARLGLAVVALLVIENLYLNLPNHLRWNVVLPGVLLGGLAVFDILLCADLVLYHVPNGTLLGARTMGMIGIAPLLAVAAARGEKWRGRVRLSRSAVFHSATLVFSGSVLLALGVAGEAFRYLGGDWGLLLEISLGFAAAIGIALLLTSASARSRFQRLFVDHFFAERYDYRRQWQACIETLSDEGLPAEARDGLAVRAIRTVVSVVDSPSGALFLRDGPAGPFQWAGSWNMKATEAVVETHPLVEALDGGDWVARLDGPHQAAVRSAPLDALGLLWLAVPLVHRGALIGFVLSGPPRAPFLLEQEVFDLLRIVAQEVATYIAEQRATQTLLQTRQLHDYSQRFAFVAHDIKNVSSQLALLVSNAEHHIANPAFQQDMLETVRLSVQKISALLARLERPEPDIAPGMLAPLPRLEALVGTYRRVRKAEVVVEHDGSTGLVAIGAEPFEAVLTHLLNNAVEAGPALSAEATARPAAPVTVRLRHEARQVVMEVVDRGAGMSAEFLRDHLFRPFQTSKAGGSGIGAYQARELVRAVGGDLTANSTPGRGTIMQVVLPRVDGDRAEGRRVDGYETANAVG